MLQIRKSAPNFAEGIPLKALFFLALTLASFQPVSAFAGIFHYGTNFLQCYEADMPSMPMNLSVNPETGEIRYSQDIFLGEKGSFTVDKQTAADLGEGNMEKFRGLTVKGETGEVLIFGQTGQFDVERISADGAKIPLLKDCQSMKGVAREWPTLDVP